MDNILEYAVKYHAAGLNVFPVNHKDKSPLVKELKPLFTDRAPIEQVRRWFSNPEVKSIGTVCGKISGRLTVIDFDAPELYFKWKEVAADVMDLSLLPVQRTGRTGGGYQVFIRSFVEFRNKKLAWIHIEPTPKNPSGVIAGIETRGEGGYVVIPPSLHPSGNHYAWEPDSARKFYIVSNEIFETLINIARSFDELADTEEETRAFENAVKTQKPHTGEYSSAIQMFNETHDIRELLISYGYTVKGDKLCRPGKREHYSVQISDNKSYHHSNNDPLHNEHLRDCFDVYCHFEFNGDKKQAVKSISTPRRFSKKQR
jgi:hypothetical protein